jgi:hypothetical protein
LEQDFIYLVDYITIFIIFRGLKGKPQQQKPVPTSKPPQQQQQPPKPVLVNTFNNDGSFLEQFKRLNDAKNKTVKTEPVKMQQFVKAELTPSGSFVLNPVLVLQYLLKYVISQSFGKRRLGSKNSNDLQIQ